jgi:predicted peptidase
MPTLPELPVLESKPFLASVGAGDLVVERLRARVNELPALAVTFPAQVRKQAEELPALAVTFPAQVRKQAEELPALAQTLPAELRKRAEELQERAEKLYGELASRGGKVVAELRGDKPATEATAEAQPKPAAKKAAAKKTTDGTASA